MKKPYFSTKKTKLYKADSRKMDQLDDESIDLILTSPPYWNLKNYKEQKQIGLGQSYEEYIKEMSKVFAECSRVLKENRYFILIIGTRVSDGQLVHIPADCVSIMKEYNLTLKKEIIWTKPKGTQGLWQRGATQFLKSRPYPMNANFNIQHEYILIFKKNSDRLEKMIEKDRLDENFIKEVCWSNWNIPVSRQKDHPAPFPLEIPIRLIKLFSFKGDIILDPFIGSGTTSVAALKLDRKSIGYDISEAFCKIAKNNIKENE